MNIIQHCSLITRLPFDFSHSIWEDYWIGNCYEYLLNYQNPSKTSITVGSLIGKEFMPYYSNQELIDTLTEELHMLGFTVEGTDTHSTVPDGKMKFFVSRSRCGDYHFYRLDFNGDWSHKLSYSAPSNLDFSGNKIFLPETACSTDIAIGYFLLGLIKK